MAYSDYTQLMNLTEKMISEMVKNLTGSNFNDRDVGTRNRNQIHEEECRVQVEESINKYEIPCSTLSRMLDKLVGHFFEDNKNYWGTPYLICDHPAIMSPLAKHSRINRTIRVICSRNRTLQCVYRIK